MTRNVWSPSIFHTPTSTLYVCKIRDSVDSKRSRSIIFNTFLLFPLLYSCQYPPLQCYPDVLLRHTNTNDQLAELVGILVRALIR